MQRRWCVPPALLRDPHDPDLLDGASILNELPRDAAVLVWQLYRDVLLWAETDPHLRPELFDPRAYRRRAQALCGCAIAPEARPGVESLTAILRRDRAVRSSAVADACRQLGTWAAGAGYGHTAIAFARLVSAVMPADPVAAADVGRIAIRFQRLAMAETWLRRAIGLARRSRSWGCYAEAYLHLGHIAAGRGDAAQARVRYLRSARTARRRGPAAAVIRGEAAHALLRLAVAAGDFAAAERFARAARRALGDAHPAAPALRNDIADLMLRRGDEPLRVIALLRDVLPSRRVPEERLDTLLLLLRVAAMESDQDLLADTWFAAVGVVDEMGSCATAARRLLQLARAAAEMGESVRAVQTARRVLDLATWIDCPAVAHEAAVFLERPRVRAP